MKKMLLGAMISLMAMFTTVMASAQIRVLVDGENLELSNTPVLENDTTLVPMRAIFEALDAKVLWDNTNKVAIAYKGTNVMEVQIDNNTMLLNGEEVTLSVPARLIDERTYVPIRAVSENFGAEVLWESDTKTVIINKKKGEKDIKTSYIDKSIVNDEGVVLMDIFVAYPEINNPDADESIAKFNEFSIKNAKAISDMLYDGYKEGVTDTYKKIIESGEEFIPFYEYYGYDVMQDKNNILSIYEQSYFASGANYQPDQYRMYNYSFDKNDLVLLSDIINVIEKDMDILSVYDFGIYEDCLLFVLNSQNAIYQHAGYSPTLTLRYTDESKEIFKINIITGEKLDYGEPVKIFKDEENVENTEKVEEYKVVEILNNKLGFNVTELSNPERYELQKYEIVNDEIARVTYKDINENLVIIQKADGDFPLINNLPTAIKTEELIGNSMVEFNETEENFNACFSIAANGNMNSYSVLVESKDMLELRLLCKEIINKEGK